MFAEGGNLRGTHERAQAELGDELAKALPIHKANVPWSPFKPPVQKSDDSWLISRKGMDGLTELKHGTANPEIYKRWRERMADHISMNNDQWADLLTYCRKRAFPITEAEVKSVFIGEINLWALAKDLYKFIAKFLADSLYDRRSTLAGSEGNGLRLWQRLFEESKGGDLLPSRTVREFPVVHVQQQR